MYRRTYWLIQFILALYVITVAVPCIAGDEPFARRSYRLGETISEVASTDYPDEKDWPGTRLFFSSDQTVVWGTDSWLPIPDIRAAMHSCWKKDKYTVWVPIKDIQEILPFEFTAAELEWNPEPYRIDKNHRIKKVKKKDLEKYADVLQYQNCPQADLPSITYYGQWADSGVIRGQFYYPRVDRTQRVDGRPRVTFSSAGLWLGDQWNTTTLYFYQPDGAAEPILFYIETTGLSSGFDRIKSLFAEAYGDPTSNTYEPVQNKMGAVFQNEIVEYRNEKGSMILTKFDSDLETGSLVHVHWPTYNALKAKLDEAKSKAALNL